MADVIILMMLKCISEKVLDHSGRDKNYHMLKHQIEK